VSTNDLAKTPLEHVPPEAPRKPECDVHVVSGIAGLDQAELAVGGLDADQAFANLGGRNPRPTECEPGGETDCAVATAADSVEHGTHVAREHARLRHPAVGRRSGRCEGVRQRARDFAGGRDFARRPLNAGASPTRMTGASGRSSRKASAAGTVTAGP